MRVTVAVLSVASYRVGHSLKLGRAPLPWGTCAIRDGRCACSRQQRVASRSPSTVLRWSEARGTATSPPRLSAASDHADNSAGGSFTVKEEEEGRGANKVKAVRGGLVEDHSAEDAVNPDLLDISDFLQPDVAFDQEEEVEENGDSADFNGIVDDDVSSHVHGYGSADPAAADDDDDDDNDGGSGDGESDGGNRHVEKMASKGGKGGKAKGNGGGGGGGIGSLEGLSADEVEQRLIAAGILRGDGAEIDFEEEDDDGGAGVYNEIEVSDGEEACRVLEERLGFDEEGIAYLRSKYPPLRGELWYRREPSSGGSKTGQKFLDVYFVEETLPDLLDLLLGEEGEGGGVGLDLKQVRGMLMTTPSLVGMDVSDAKDVVGYLRSELGLSGKGQLASALAGCPPMLMYHAWDNLRMKVSYYREALAWTNEDVAAMLAEFPNLLSIKMENDVIEVIDYLRTEVGLQPFTVSGMVRDFPQVLEVRPKRLKAVVRYLWKVLEIPRSGIAVLLSQHPRACCLEAEANLAPLRQFFERELFVEDTSRIGHLVYKFPRLLFQDVDTQLVPRAEEFRKAMGLEGLEPLPPRVRPRPKRTKFRSDDTGGRGGRGRGRGRGRGAGGGSGRPRSANSSSGGGGGLSGRGGGGGGSRSGAGRARSANSGFGGRGQGQGGRGAGRWPSGRGRGGGGRPSDGRGVGGRGGGEYRGRGGGYME